MAGAGKSLTCVVAQSIPLLTGPFADLRKDTAGALGCGMLKLGHGQTLRRLGDQQGLEGFLCGDGSHLGLERCSEGKAGRYGFAGRSRPISGDQDVPVHGLARH